MYTAEQVTNQDYLCKLSLHDMKIHECDIDVVTKYRIKATEYGIKFDEHDWCINAYGHIIDVVNDWEVLVARARDEHNVYWDIDDYDYEHLQYLISSKINYQNNIIGY